MIPLTRTCRLADFPDCRSAADWQQRLATEAYARWAAQQDGHLPASAIALCLNWSGCAFTAPGPHPVYRTGGGELPDTLPREHILRVDMIGAVFALSVLDRIEAPQRFLSAYSRRLLPGGLLFCTFAAWDADGTDCATGCEIRTRIYNYKSWQKLVREIRSVGLTPFGGVDFTYYGSILGDHTIASLVLTKGDPR